MNLGFHWNPLLNDTVDLYVLCFHGSNLKPSTPVFEDDVTMMSQKRYCKRVVR